MATKKIVIPNPTKGYGYIGTFRDNTLGWFMSEHLSRDKKYPGYNYRAEGFVKPNQRFFLCEIVLKPIKDKLGRPITKIIKGKNGVKGKNGE